MKQLLLLLQQVIDELRGLRLQKSESVDYSLPLTRKEAAAFLKCSERSVEEWSKKGLLAFSKLGDGNERAPIRYDIEDLRDFALKKRRIGVIGLSNGSRRSQVLRD